MTNQEKEKQFIFDRYVFDMNLHSNLMNLFQILTFMVQLTCFFNLIKLFFDDVKIISEISSESNCASEIETEFSSEEIYHYQSEGKIDIDKLIHWGSRQI